MDIEERLEQLAEFAPQYKAIAIDAAREIRRLRERERLCPTMQEAESRALWRCLQECCVVAGLSPATAGPPQLIERVRQLRELAKEDHPCPK